MQRISWRSSFHNAWRVPTDQKEWTTIPNREAGKECFLWKDYSNSSQMFSLTENSTAIQRYFPPTTLAKIDPPERTLPHAGVGDTLRVHAAFASFECQSHTTLKISVVLHFRHCDCLSGVGTLWFLQGFSERDGSCLRGASWARAAPGHRPPAGSQRSPLSETCLPGKLYLLCCSCLQAASRAEPSSSRGPALVSSATTLWTPRRSPFSFRSLPLFSVAPPGGESVKGLNEGF